MSTTATVNRAGKPKTQGSDEHEILFQHWFKSVGPRTYATQLKKANNGNHYLVLTEGKRDDKTGEVRKTRLFVFSEDFVEFFRMLKETAQFVRDHPVPDSVKKKRDRFWAKKGGSPSAMPGPKPQAVNPPSVRPPQGQPSTVSRPARSPVPGAHRPAPTRPISPAGVSKAPVSAREVQVG